MRTLEAIRPSQLPQPLVSAGARLGTALAVAALVSVAWLGVESASRDAVQVASMALSPGVLRVTLPTVEINARRDPAALAGLAPTSSRRAAPQAL